MNNLRQKIKGIIDELLFFQLDHNAHGINMNLRRCKDGYLLRFESDCGEQASLCADILNRFFHAPKDEAIEGSFWELAGEDHGVQNEELQLIGQMADRADAQAQGSKLIIELFKSK